VSHTNTHKDKQTKLYMSKLRLHYLYNAYFCDDYIKFDSTLLLYIIIQETKMLVDF